MYGSRGGWPSSYYAYNLSLPHIDENDDARRPWTMTGIILTIMKDYDKDKLEPGYHVSLQLQNDHIVISSIFRQG